METSLHRQLKALYAGPAAVCEARIGRFRIDAIAGDELIEIQQSALAAIRRKIIALCTEQPHAPIRVVKPLVAAKTIIRRDCVSGQELSRRSSPKAETIWDLFLELVHFIGAFPHPRLILEVVLTELEELRGPIPLRTARRRRGHSRDPVLDRRLIQLTGRIELRTARDLWALLPRELPTPFTTHDLAEVTGLPRWWAQKVAYVLKHAGAIGPQGKRQRAWLYAPTADVLAPLKKVRRPTATVMGAQTTRHPSADTEAPTMPTRPQRSRKAA